MFVSGFLKVASDYSTEEHYVDRREADTKNIAKLDHLSKGKAALIGGGIGAGVGALHGHGADHNARKREIVDKLMSMKKKPKTDAQLKTVVKRLVGKTPIKKTHMRGQAAGLGLALGLGGLAVAHSHNRQVDHAKADMKLTPDQRRAVFSRELR